MATKLGQLAKSCLKTRILTSRTSNSIAILPVTRSLSLRSTTIPGAIPPEPLKKRFSVPIVLFCMAVGVTTGSYIAKSFAAFLEETEMFVPEEDDD